MPVRSALRRLRQEDAYQDPVAKPKKITATKRENKEDISPVGGDRFSHAKETKQMSKVRNARAS